MQLHDNKESLTETTKQKLEKFSLGQSTKITTIELLYDRTKCNVLSNKMIVKLCSIYPVNWLEYTKKNP